jgi:hypothetical protein
LIRYARENDNRQVVERLFDYYSETASENGLWQTILGVPPDKSLETLDTESVFTDLTYREAMDLNWALGVARQAVRKRGLAAEPPR